MYSLADFGRMIEDRARLDAHAEALRRTLTPTSIVLDIGAGTGIMSLLACRLGARRVYAVESSSAVQLLVEAARDNGYADRIVILQRRSTEVTLPERADVIVSDLRGVLPPFQSHFADLADARERLLAPGGRLLPETDTLRLAVVSAPEAFARRRRPWLADPHGVVLRSALRFVDHTMQKHRAQAGDLVCEPVPWARLHYPTLSERRVRGGGTCTITRSGAAHGLLVWFDTELVEGVGYSSGPGAPGAPEGIYGQILFPWPEEISLRAGDVVAFDLRADPIGAEVLWTWSTEIHRRGEAAPVVRSLRQSTFGSLLMSPDSLRTRASTFVPALSPTGALALRVLEGMRAGRTIGDLAGELHAAEPGRFRTRDDAHGFVADLSERYGG